MWAAMKLEQEGYEFTRERIRESELPPELVRKHPLAVAHLTKGTSRQAGAIARALRAMTAVREGITDRHVARYLVQIVRCVARQRIRTELANLLRCGDLMVAYDLERFWTAFCEYTLREISEKPEVH